MAFLTLAVCCLLSLSVVHSQPSEAENDHTVFVLIGGTGDLAAKYLWQGVFNVYRSYMDRAQSSESIGGPLIVNLTFDFFTAARQSQDLGNATVKKILSYNVTCDQESEDREDGFSLSLCQKWKSELINKVVYTPLQNEEDFVSLCSQIISKFSLSVSQAKKEVLIYMAIAPSAYKSVLQNLNKHCHGLRENKVKIKVALEKPFGIDKASAETMSKQILKYFREDEIYRVDHFLGKPVVKAILPFRAQNSEIEKILDKDHVEKVEIFLKETIGIEDRVHLYNSLGVLRDIHQNHLTQLLTLVAMDLPSDLRDTAKVQENKERLLRQVETVRRHNSLFGQFSDYADLVKKLESNLSVSVDVPTFAATVVKINSPRWRSVPFLLVSGKSLDIRESFVRIIFKNNYVCVSQCDDQTGNEQSSYFKQVVFHIGHGSVKRPSILVSKSFRNPDCPDNFLESIDPSLFTSVSVYGEKASHFYICSVVKDIPAYESIISNMLVGKQENFVNTKILLLSWQIWDYLVNAEKKVRIYDKSDHRGHLNFVIKESQLEYVHDDDEGNVVMEDEKVVTHSEVMHEYVQTPATFLGRKLKTSHSDHLAFLLARDIDLAAGVEIQNKGSFHIAFSGGTSLTKLFQVLAQSFANLHWHSIHVWQVDERCVPHQDERSNFQMLDRELLRFVDIPYSNIHAMPVYTGGMLCDDELGGAHAYADTLRHIVPNSQLDYVILGLGADGHTASLFPFSSDIHVDTNTFVVTTDDGPAETNRRMTITLPLINKAKNVAIFVTGKHKRDIVNQLETSKSVDKYPVLGVNPINGTVTWYMDYNAYTGGVHVL
ncbi:GDH/6PGL endoplasmic bifunctional protein [Biomphalaria pfeifferi]|uniref:GDH/6PGL endoplasmic bifunctional protein n=1 Tax=Biomphalaria pfeifferi TaxID=112525 RepID=A0AAD8FDH2_BIOPF|nr:GDH/6PGL endoplasmic bifunctional protein [Biomphalaria pfeifferi]